MDKEVTLTTEEILRIYKFIEKAQGLFHQPMYYKDPEMVQKFASENYPEIHELYYHLLWDKLPKHVQESILEQ